MKCLFDTSALIAALLTGHTHHSACLPFLLQAQSQEIQGLIATHTLAELYSVLTRIPKTKISPAREWVEELMRIDLNRLPFYQRGERAMAIIQQTF